MRANIKKIGNSKGVVIPPLYLSKLNLDKDSPVDIEITNEEIIIKPVKNPRADWNKVFSDAINKGEKPDTDLFDEMSNNFDDEEWTW